METETYYDGRIGGGVQVRYRKDNFGTWHKSMAPAGSSPWDEDLDALIPVGDAMKQLGLTAGDMNRLREQYPFSNCFSNGGGQFRVRPNRLRKMLEAAMAASEAKPAKKRRKR
ncbi:MAG TPA: hypothetical protein VMF62_12280 [Acetobacteraceae bacterium]|nr:hypothetical protein [Acetobacteraceae bacterium]